MYIYIYKKHEKNAPINETENISERTRFSKAATPISCKIDWKYDEKQLS